LKKKTDPFNTKVGQICKICGFGSNPRDISSPMSKQDLEMHMPSHDSEKIRFLTYSGQIIEETGYYSYRSHLHGWHPECFVAPQTKIMLFKKGEKAPKLGSCNHVIEWMFVAKV